MLIFLFQKNCKSHECQHDKEFESYYKAQRRMPKAVRKPNPHFFTQKGYNPPREPIRVKFDFSYVDIEGPDYILKCKTVGQVIYWRYIYYNCTSNDLLTTKKREVIIKTFTNLQDYLSKTLNVTRMTSSFELVQKYSQDGSDLLLTSGTVSDVDMYLQIVPRPFIGSSVLASAVSIKSEDSEGRPIHGIVFINLAKLPNNPQSFDQYPHEFFATCFHEVCHALGVTNDKMDTWIDRKTGVEYASGELLKTVSLGKKTFTFLITPEAHRYATKRFGTETFHIGEEILSSGIEIEDGGGTGTSGSHPESRVYFGEAMAGYSTTDSVISDLSLALLTDTGWYDVNYEMAYGHIWGNGLAINGEPNPKFATEPMQTVNMKNHLCSKQDAIGCTYDYKAVGICKAESFDCTKGREGYDYESKSHDAFCDTQSFFNPNKYSIRGVLSTLDYIMYTSPYSNRDCLDPATFEADEVNGEAGINSRCFERSGGTYSGRFGCFQTRCNGLDLYVKFDGYEYQCKEEGEKVGGILSKIICPPPEIICRGMAVSQRLPADPFNASWTPELMRQTEPLAGTQWFTTTRLIIIAVVVVVAIIICIIICCCAKSKNKKRRVGAELSDELSDNEDDMKKGGKKTKN
jgi:hypothetical protein